MEDYDGALQPKRLPWKLIIPIGIALLIVMGALLAWFMRARSASTLLIAKRAEDIGREVLQADAACARAADPRTCTSTLVASAARVLAAPEACRHLKESVAIDNCLWGVAATTSDIQLCTQIQDAWWADACHDGIIRAQAFAAGKADACQPIKNSAKQKTCREALDPTTAANCKARGGSVETCADLAMLEQAKQAEDRSVCDSIKDKSRRGQCLELISDDTDRDGLTTQEEKKFGTDPHNPDTDGDGLTDGDEVHVYRTNPLKADTDGDGFKDGEEVRKGYNPNGPGKPK